MQGARNFGPNRPRPFGVTLGVLKAIVLGLVLLWCNPLDSVSKYASARLYYRAKAVDYPSVRPNALMVLASDRTNIAAKRGDAPEGWSAWPLNLGAWASAIDFAEQRGAKIIFLDVALIDRRSTSEESALKSSIAFAAQSAEVYLADPGPRPDGETLAGWLKSEIPSSHLHLVSVARGASDGLDDVYSLTTQGGEPPAAVAMARTYCEQGGKGCSSRLLHLPPSKTMDIWWATPFCDLAKKAPCPLAHIGFAARTIQLLVAQSLSGVCANLHVLCDVAPPPVSAGYAFRVAPLEAYVDPDSADYATFKAEVVFIGGDFAFGRDLATSTVYGRTSGLHVQAMAFDNLVTMGGRVITQHFPFGMSENAFLSTWISVAILIIHLGRARVRRFADVRQIHWRLAAFAWQCGVIGIFLLLLLIPALAYPLAPVNWIAAATAVSIVSSREFWGGHNARL